MQQDDGSAALVSPPVVERWNRAFEAGSDKRFPSLELVRLEKWHFASKPGRVLDYGCGSGVNLIYLMEVGYEVDGFDTSTEGLRVVERKLAQRPDLGSKATLKRITASDDRLPAEDGTYDYVICFSVLSLLSTKERVSRVLAEFARVMKPGAKGIFDINGPVGDFAKAGTSVGDDVYEHEGGDNDITFRAYCPQDPKTFAKLLEPHFRLDDMGYYAYGYMGADTYEFIACVTRP